jgi:hypothetical protein
LRRYYSPETVTIATRVEFVGFTSAETVTVPFAVPLDGFTVNQLDLKQLSTYIRSYVKDSVLPFEAATFKVNGETNSVASRRPVSRLRLVE